MNINLVAESRSVHSRALYVPARAAFAPGRFPKYFALFCRLPKREIERIAFVLLVFDAHAFVSVLQLSAAEFSVIRKTLHCKVHVAARSRICVSAFDQFADEIDYIVNIAGGFEPHVGVVHVESAHKRVDALYHRFGIFESGYSRLARARDDLVVYVRIIASVCNGVSALLQILAYHVVYQRLIRVSYVRVARHRYTARIHIYTPLCERRKFFFSAAERIIDFHISIRKFVVNQH